MGRLNIAKTAAVPSAGRKAARGESPDRHLCDAGAKGGIPLNRQTPSIQDYLKVLLELSEDGKPVLSIDIAQALGFSRASVCRAMNVLQAGGYITKEKYGPAILTAHGREAALSVRKRHDLIMAFLMDVLGVEKAAAESDACRMEHAVSRETAEKLERYLGAYAQEEKCIRIERR